MDRGGIRGNFRQSVATVAISRHPIAPDVTGPSYALPRAISEIGLIGRPVLRF